MHRFLPPLFAAAVLGASPVPAAAQLFRWIDERGTVNYGDTPPANARQVTPLNPDKSGVSVVPGLTREDLDRAKKRSEQARIERLEREVDALREDSGNRPPPPPPPPPAAEPVYAPYYYDGRLRPPRPNPNPHPHPKPLPKPIEPPPPPPPPLYTRPK
jgi:hypothetical protein